jgi:two-component system, NtrC family, nitrogen regulation sensor histidine kinase NtrY
VSGRGHRLRHQNQILLLTLAAAGPTWLTAAVLLWQWDADPALRWAAFALITLFLAAGALVLRRRVVMPLQSLANLLEALREGDYSLRGRNADPADAVGEVMIEVNMLSRTLHDQRLQAVEAGVLLQKVIAEIDMAVFAFDAEGRLRLVNRAGTQLMAADAARLLGRSAVELGLGSILDEPSGRIVSRVFPGGSGRWEVRRRSFREGGRPHELVVISELSRALRDEERQAWQRLVRVIGHELNNSLAPIKSMASTLTTLLSHERLPDDWRDDTMSALRVISDRADALGRFMGAYATLARLPPPRKRAVAVPSLVQRAVSLQAAAGIVDEGGPDVVMSADADQLEQVLINLLKNALEAAGADGRVAVRWRLAGDWLEVEVEDDGPGLADTENLWVPFFTTKPGGTGIGLVLCREIIEAHGGRITLENRDDAQGCLARLRLPLAQENPRLQDAC